MKGKSALKMYQFSSLRHKEIYTTIAISPEAALLFLKEHLEKQVDLIQPTERRIQHAERYKVFKNIKVGSLPDGYVVIEYSMGDVIRHERV